MYDSDPVKLFSHLLKELSKKKVAYVEIKEPAEDDASRRNEIQPKTPLEQSKDIIKELKPFFSRAIMVN